MVDKIFFVIGNKTFLVKFRFFFYTIKISMMRRTKYFSFDFPTDIVYGQELFLFDKHTSINTFIAAEFSQNMN